MPFVVLLSAIVGFADVRQQTPRAVIAAPPSLVIMPPLVALVTDIEDIVVVVIAGYAAPDHTGIPEAESCKN